MQNNKAPSFTLSELLIVMIITAIVVGIAFSVLRLVQQQIYKIERNFNKTISLNLLEQTLWQDFNTFTLISFNKGDSTLILESVNDTIQYKFQESFILRNSDTIKVKVVPTQTFFRGKTVDGGMIDAIKISAENELPDHTIFVCRQIDAAVLINIDGI